jgi:hypothetical protein
VSLEKVLGYSRAGMWRPLIGPRSKEAEQDTRLTKAPHGPLVDRHIPLRCRVLPIICTRRSGFRVHVERIMAYVLLPT